MTLSKAGARSPKKREKNFPRPSALPIMKRSFLTFSSTTATLKGPASPGIVQKILSRRNRSAFVKLHPALSRYYQEFSLSLIYNALMSYDFKGDFDGLSDFIYPSIPAADIKDRLDDLLTWGLVHPRESGRYTCTVTKRFVEPPATSWNR